jgi:uncharacterized protein with beta-barrel porin domain
MGDQRACSEAPNQVRRRVARNKSASRVSFIVNGAILAKDSALVSADAELDLADGTSLPGKFDGEFGRHLSTYAGTGTGRVVW